MEIYNQLVAYSGIPTTVICNLHSACEPEKNKNYLCSYPGSKTSVINFDKIKALADKAKGGLKRTRKSVDALTVTPSGGFLCFVELKSWELVLMYNGTECSVRQKAAKYTSALPLKLSDSMNICEQITNNPDTFGGCRIMYILVTDISVADDGIMAFNSDLTALSGTSSNLKDLCNSLSQGIMNEIKTVETRYWECRSFDKNLSAL
ncbi:MAG: hypothetical protein K2M97_03295 [Muribaculaceae bacterium]|nr:hypothetical protein [Muribaculaceae bacterium]